jgi:NADH dehydrogenase
MLHEFAAGTIPDDRNKVSFVAHASRNHFHFWPGSLNAVDRGARKVTLAPLIGDDGRPVVEARAIAYDALIVAIGSRANDFGLPGIAEHCRFIDNLGEAEAFFGLFRTAVLRAIDHGTTLDIAIVGGGATGVELAAELHRAIDIASGYKTGMPRAKLHIALIEAGPRILPAFPERVSQDAETALRHLGIDVMTGVDIAGADARGFIRKDGQRLDAEIRVWAAGRSSCDRRYNRRRMTRSSRSATVPSSPRSTCRQPPRWPASRRATSRASWCAGRMAARSGPSDTATAVPS